MAHALTSANAPHRSVIGNALETLAEIPSKAQNVEDVAKILCSGSGVVGHDGKCYCFNGHCNADTDCETPDLSNQKRFCCPDGLYAFDVQEQPAEEHQQKKIFNYLVRTDGASRYDHTFTVCGVDPGIKDVFCATDGNGDFRSFSSAEFYSRSGATMRMKQTRTKKQQSTPNIIDIETAIPTPKISSFYGDNHFRKCRLLNYGGKQRTGAEMKHIFINGGKKGIQHQQRQEYPL
ncbi:uncharacterized protein BX664DRAFT_348977 [Halteromyces radiatus]|uniref:uncharacterized protein n=1 Tax=Halteromyces radiatus TaxID=101107 RepID=UPI00221EF265|nr:uncharacterized protein BX664DRAFT_348977 [Halteromyces radiatus]KAI8093793.1 hypothetical protein BX664DRAFT_348977 [Halteromyces radiatus]